MSKINTLLDYVIREEKLTGKGSKYDSPFLGAVSGSTESAIAH